MFVKYDENKEIVSLFVGCIPEDTAEYVEIPDDEAVVKEYIEKHKTPVIQPEATPEERIAALEEQLAAAKILLGVE